MLILPQHTSIKPAGALLEDGRQVADLLQCGHCQYTWQLKPGSGRVRGFCYRCMRVLCGASTCQSGCGPLDRNE